MPHAVILENVSKKLTGRYILKDVSFNIESGDIFGYLGPNGAGKTTTIRILLGLMTPTSGKLSLLGKDVSHDATREHVGFVLETDGLYDNMTALENLVFYSGLYGGRFTDRINHVLDLVRLADRARDKVGAYSRGMRQRLALARAMVHDPDILILDEPTAGVDPTGQIEVRQIILDMAAEGKTIFFSSHNLDEVQRICNRIALIDRGQIRLYGEKDKLQRQMGRREVVIETTEPVAEDVLQQLCGLSGLNILETSGNTLVISTDNGLTVPDIVMLLVQKGLRLEQVKRREASIEEIYTSILKEAGS